MKAQSSLVSLYSEVKGEYNVEGDVIIGESEFTEFIDQKKNKVLTCGRFKNGKLKSGKFVETGLPKVAKKLNKN